MFTYRVLLLLVVLVVVVVGSGVTYCKRVFIRRLLTPDMSPKRLKTIRSETTNIHNQEHNEP